MTEMADIFYCSIGLICCITWIAILMWIIADHIVDWYRKRKRRK